MHGPAMTINRETAAEMRDPIDSSIRKAELASIGGILAALGAASCCVVPFALFVQGVSGAWISNLTALEPYQPVFAPAAFASPLHSFYPRPPQPTATCALV